MKFLFLCNELTGYFANCIERLQQTSGADVTIVYYPNSATAPFEHNLPHIDLINRHKYKGFELLDQCLSHNYDMVYVSGWMDHDYKRIAKRLKQKGVIVVCGLDNVWRGTIRQYMACLFSAFLLKPFYTHLWVAGHRQYQFARRLGYSHENIISGLYAADVDRFKLINQHPKEHKLVFVGRFEPIKGIQLLYDVFSSLTKEERRGWTLDIIGNGSLKESMASTEYIGVYDFLQPEELIKFVSDAGGFILPSVEEPWGVVVQEFAAAGKPLLLSMAVNSGEDYLIHGYNGFRFKQEDAGDLKAKLIHFFSLEDQTRFDMGQRSAELALRGEPKLWVANLLSLLP